MNKYLAANSDTVENLNMRVDWNKYIHCVQKGDIVGAEKALETIEAHVTKARNLITTTIRFDNLD